MLVGYARVSTLDQDPSLQVDALTRANCSRVFVEQASGAQRDRPELKAALSFLRTGDTLVVWKLDRLARSLRQLIDTVEGLEGTGVGLLSITEQIDTSTSGGRLVFHLFGALAEFERSIIRDRTMAGLEAARLRGRFGGRPPSLSPEDQIAGRAMLADPAINASEVARRLRVSVSTLYRYFPAAKAQSSPSDINPGQSSSF